MIWLIVLPLALAPSCGWACIPTQVLVSFCFLGIEEIGIKIEEPFSILSCEAICAAVKLSCEDMLNSYDEDVLVVAKPGPVPLAVTSTV